MLRTASIFIMILASSILLDGCRAESQRPKRIVLITIAGELLCGVGLWLASGDGQTPLWAMYTAIGALALCFTFESPAASALLPTLVPRERFQSAVTVQSAVRGLGWVTGPVLTGFLIAASGIELSYIVQIACTGLALATLTAVKRTLEATSRQPVTLESIREHFRV